MPAAASVVLERLISELLLTYRFVADLHLMLAIDRHENAVS